MADDDPQARVRRWLWGFRLTSVLVASVRLGLVERLSQGPAGADELAAVLGAERGTLLRLLRVLVAYRLVALDGDRYELTEAGRALHQLRDFARLIDAEYLPAWAHLEHSLRTGEPAFEHVFGMPVWQHRQEHAELDTALNRTMRSYERARGVAAILDTCDLSDLGLFVDLGGGNGAEVIEILRRYPRARAIVFDQPHVVPTAKERIEAAGLQARGDVVGGSLLEEVPAGGTVYMLKQVLHNWPDATCVQVLRTCRAAMGPESRLLVIDRLMPADLTTESPDGHWDAGLMDLHMLAVLGGRERTLVEFDALFEAAGLARIRCLDAGGAFHLLEARCARDPGATG